MNRREREAWLMAQWARRRVAATRGPMVYAPPPPSLPRPVLPANRSVARQHQLRRSAAAVDLQIARCSRWSDTIGLLSGHAPEYLVPLLAYAVGVRSDVSMPCSSEDATAAPVQDMPPQDPDAED